MKRASMAPSLENVRKPDECAFTTEHIGRVASIPLTRLAMRMGLSANAVTLLSGTAWFVALPLTVLAGEAFARGAALPAWTLLIVCALLWTLGYLLDLVDGNIARLTGSACASGFYLDYVFHLLIKPTFLLSIGVMLYLTHGHASLLVPAILSVPANWSASESAVEHVICQMLGKQRFVPANLTPEDRAAILLGMTGIQTPTAEKTRSRGAWIQTVLREVLSYYGQFALFSLLVLADLVLFIFFPEAPGPLPCTTAVWFGLTLALCARLPARLRREFRRAAILDQAP